MILNEKWRWYKEDGVYEDSSSLIWAVELAENERLKMMFEVEAFDWSSLVGGCLLDFYKGVKVGMWVVGGDF